MKVTAVSRQQPADMAKIFRTLLVGEFNQQMVKAISAIENVEIVGQCLNGEVAINSYDELAVDMILMDMIMPGMHGLETARWIKEQDASIRIVLLSEHLSYEFLMACLELKLDGCLLKSSPIPVFAETLRSCLQSPLA